MIFIMRNKNFYTYICVREDGTPYYVGKGTGNRAFYSYRYNRAVALPKDRSRVLIQEHPSDKDALEAEKFLIAYYGRKDLGTGPLRNRTDGGEGLCGLIRTAEHCRNISQANLGRKVSVATRKKLSDSHKGYQPNENQLRGLATAHGPKSDAWKAAMRTSWTPKRRQAQSDYTWQRHHIQIL